MFKNNRERKKYKGMTPAEKRSAKRKQRDEDTEDLVCIILPTIRRNKKKRQEKLWRE